MKAYTERIGPIIRFAICVICLALMLCGCKSEEQRAAEIDPSDLTGVRVGVNLA